jgi:hypothetical protein
VQRSESSLTADLDLVGTPSNVFGEDLQDLKFLAEWQTGMSATQSIIDGCDIPSAVYESLHATPD